MNEERNVKISVITIAYQSEATIEDTLKSVLKQRFEDFEHIIVDGGSTDGTMEIVKRYEAQYEGRLCYVSEQDRGIYDAINKGIHMARGEVIGLLHSDDFFYNQDTLTLIAERFEKAECKGIYGDLIFVDPDDISNVCRAWIAGKGRFGLGWTIPHQTIYLRREVYQQFGDYLTDMKNAADNEYILRVCKDGGVELEYIHEVLVVMKLGGASTKNLASNKTGFQEVQRSLSMHGIHFPYLVNWLRLLRKGNQIIRAKVNHYDL